MVYHFVTWCAYLLACNRGVRVLLSQQCHRIKNENTDNCNGRMKTRKFVYILFLWLSQSFIDLRSTFAATTPCSANLSCYDCNESFKYVWEPYTACQYYPQSTPLRPCLGVERYCKVERVTYKSVTVSITRSCTQECWHGCYASGFGLTKLRCTSCCLESGCNVGDNACNTVAGIYFTLAISALTFISIL